MPRPTTNQKYAALNALNLLTSKILIRESDKSRLMALVNKIYASVRSSDNLDQRQRIAFIRELGQIQIIGLMTADCPVIIDKIIILSTSRYPRILPGARQQGGLSNQLISNLLSRISHMVVHPYGFLLSAPSGPMVPSRYGPIAPFRYGPMAPLHYGPMVPAGLLPQRPPALPQRPPALPQRPPALPQRPPALPQQAPIFPRDPPTLNPVRPSQAPSIAPVPPVFRPAPSIAPVPPVFGPAPSIAPVPPMFGPAPSIASVSSVPPVAREFPSLEIFNFIINHPVYMNLGQTIQDPALKSRVTLDHRSIQLIIIFLRDFINDVLEEIHATGVLDNYGRFISKSYRAGIPGQPNYKEGIRGHSILLYTKREDPFVARVIIKSNTQVGSGIGENVLYSRGSTKTAKIFQLFLTFNFEDGANFECALAPIVTLTRLSPGRGKSGPYGSHEFAKKSNDLRELIKDPQFEKDFATWEDWLEYTDSRYPQKPRIIGYQVNKGSRDCGKSGEALRTWLPAQKIHGMITFLYSMTDPLQKGFWLTDLKYPNTCLTDKVGQFSDLCIIDYEGTGATICLYKAPGVMSDHPDSRIRLVNLYTYLSLVDRLKDRQSLTDEQFKILVFEWLFEIAVNMYYLWNIDQAFSDYYRLTSCRSPLSKTQVSSIWSQREFGLFLLKYTYGQNFNLSVYNIVEIFMTELGSIISKISGYQTQISLSWVGNIARLISNIPNSPTPYHPIQIRKLKLV